MLFIGPYLMRSRRVARIFARLCPGEPSGRAARSRHNSTHDRTHGCSFRYVLRSVPSCYGEIYRLYLIRLYFREVKYHLCAQPSVEMLAIKHKSGRELTVSSVCCKEACKVLLYFSHGEPKVKEELRVQYELNRDISSPGYLRSISYSTYGSQLDIQ